MAVAKQKQCPVVEFLLRDNSPLARAYPIVHNNPNGGSTSPPRKGIAVIYFTQDMQNKTIKIGYSKNPKKRRAGLQSSNSSPLILLGAIHGGLEHEYAYHQKFAQYRLHGEWFKADILPAVLEIIAKNPPDRSPPSNVIVIGDSDSDFMWSSNPDQVARKNGLEVEVFQSLDELHAKNPIAWLITGGERQLDHFVWRWADQKKVEICRFLPNWKKYGRFAAFKVGPQMLRRCLIRKWYSPFWGKRSPQIRRTSSVALRG